MNFMSNSIYDCNNTYLMEQNLLFVKYNEHILIDNDTLLSIVIILTHALKRSIISS